MKDAFQPFLDALLLKPNAEPWRVAVVYALGAYLLARR